MTIFNILTIDVSSQTSISAEIFIIFFMLPSLLSSSHRQHQRSLVVLDIFHSTNIHSKLADKMKNSSVKCERKSIIFILLCLPVLFILTFHNLHFTPPSFSSCHFLFIYSYSSCPRAIKHFVNKFEWFSFFL